MRLVRTTSLLACLLLLPGLATPATAHPHAWIVLESRAVFDEDRRVAAVEVEWLFDEFYTLFLQDALPADPEARQDALNRLAETNLQNLKEFNYFVHPKADGQALPVTDVVDYETEIRHGRVWMRFTVGLETAVDPREKLLTYASYDPTYFVEILHAQDESAGVAGPGSDGCNTRIIAPTPSLEMIAEAAAIGINEQAPATLGILFAERVVVRCP